MAVAVLFEACRARVVRMRDFLENLVIDPAAATGPAAAATEPAAVTELVVVTSPGVGQAIAGQAHNNKHVLHFRSFEAGDKLSFGSLWR